uniref:Peptidase C14 caspase domain-containing protein n=1 Tax=viral metagenome TaxID=1070528 RepID=A0A6C0EIL1_9ZZZZ
MVLINAETSKYAVIIGINYTGTDLRLNGCVDDANEINAFLLEKCNYQTGNIKLLTDVEGSIQPTKENIIYELRALVQKAKVEGITEFWFSYSGHGSNVTNRMSGETDGKDEVIVPLDYPTTKSLITDNELHEIFSMLPTTCNLFSLIDACNSGTVLDLQYVCRLDNNNILSYEDHSLSQPDSVLSANIIKISGCRDEQTSAEDYINGTYRGVLTYYFLECLKDLDYNCSSEQLIINLKTKVTGLYTQIPTLTCSNKDILSSLIMKKYVPIPEVPVQEEPEEKRRRIKKLLKKAKNCAIL